MATQAIAAYGTKFAIADDRTGTNLADVAEVTNIDGPGMSSNVVDVTSHDGQATNALRAKIATLIDGGEVTLDLNFVPATHGANALNSLIKAFTDKSPRKMRITWTDAGNTQWLFIGVVSAFQPTASVDGALTATCTVTVTESIKLDAISLGPDTL